MRRTFALLLVVFLAMGTGLAFAQESDVEQEKGDGVLGGEAVDESMPVVEADDGDDMGDEADADRDGLSGSLYRVSEILNLVVTGDSDEQIGKALEVVINAEGEITHLIALLDDLEGLESGSYLVPVSAIVTYDTESVTVDATEAQGFARFDDVNTGSDGAGQLPEGTSRSSAFMEYEVVLASDDAVVGETYDVVVDLETNRVLYVAVSTNGDENGTDGEYHAIAFDKLEVNADARNVRVDMSENEFELLEGFDLAQWPTEAGTSLVGAGLDDTAE